MNFSEETRIKDNNSIQIVEPNMLRMEMDFKDSGRPQIITTLFLTTLYKFNNSQIRTNKL